MHARLKEGISCRFIWGKGKSVSSTPPALLLRGAEQLPWLVTQFPLYRPFLLIQIRAVPKDLLDTIWSHTSCSLLKLLYSPSKGFPTKRSEPANANISAFSKSSASNGDLFCSYREGNNSTEKKQTSCSASHSASLRGGETTQVTALSFVPWSPELAQSYAVRDKLQRGYSFI